MAPMASGGPRISGRGSDKHHAAGSRIMIAGRRCAVLMAIRSQSAAMATPDVWWSFVQFKWLVISPPLESFQIPISCSREFIYYAFILFLCFLD